MIPSPRFLALSLRLMGALLPGYLRPRWKREWEGELAHRPRWSLLFAALRDALYLVVVRPGIRPLAPRPIHKPRDSRMFAPLLQDLRFSLRTLRSAPWYSLVTVMTLALGIGASVAMFGVLHAVFLKPLPFPDPDRLVMGRATFDGQMNTYVAGADYYDYRDQAASFQELGALMPGALAITVSAEGGAEQVRGSVAAPDLFAALGIRPQAGRLFVATDGEEGAPAVVIISHDFWTRRTGTDPTAVGSTLTLDGTVHTVVGILPPNFFFMAPADLWIPMRPDQYGAGTRDRHNWFLVGRLAPEVSQTEAQAEVDLISARLAEAYPESNATKGLLLSDLHGTLTGDYRLSLWILSGAVALVLLIACGNGAGILLARAPTRYFELSVRSAMGAPRGRLVRQLLSESMGLALAGGVLGTGFALWFQDLILNYLRMDRLGAVEVDLSLPVLGAALGLSLLTGLLAGLYPSLRSAAGPLTDGLKSGHRIGSDGGSAFRSGLVVTQVALSVILLVGSGLLVRSMVNLTNLDPGFRPENLLTARVQLPRGRFPGAEARLQYATELRAALEAIPGVISVGMGTHVPIGDRGNTWRTYTPEREETRVRTFLRPVFPGYLETLGIPIRSGRAFTEADRRESTPVAILSETAARSLFPGENPVGKILHMETFSEPLTMEVVGVSGDVRLTRLEEEPEVALYIPFSQRTWGILTVAAKTRTSPMTLAAEFEATFRAVDPEIPPTRISTLESLVTESLADRRIITLSLTLLALLPLALASVGLFAILAYHVSRRRHEMGVRMALGAPGASVGGMILKQGMGLVALGVVVGLAGAWGATRLLASLLFGVGTTDPLTLAGVAALVISVAVLACAIPVWRAVRSDPRVVLQAE